MLTPKRENLQTLILTIAAFFVWMLPASQPAFGQKKATREAYMEQIQVKKISSKKKDADSLSLALQFKLDSLHLDRQHLLLLTPIVHDASHSTKLPSIAIEGRVRRIILDRKSTNERTKIYGAAEDIQRIKHQNGTAQTLEYNQILPYETWYKNASLSIEASVVGCGNCGIENERILVSTAVLDTPPVAKYHPSLIIPPVEKRKQRSKEYTAYLNYPVSGYVILPNFMDNQRELSNIRKAIEEVQNDLNLKIVSPIYVSGYASPEGKANSNQILSERRAAALATYISKNFGIERSTLKVQGFGEDWNGLVERVKKSSLDDKEAILNIVATVDDLDARDTPLRAIQQGRTYKELLETIYPLLRRNTFLIHYEVKAFDVEEAKAVLQKHPEQLSLNEMYLVSQTMDKTSVAYKDLFATAYKLFPSDPIAIINEAAMLLDDHKGAEAIELLTKVADNSLAWNNLGIAYALIRDYDSSARYFDKAIAAGSVEAKNNKEEMLTQRSFF